MFRNLCEKGFVHADVKGDNVVIKIHVKNTAFSTQYNPGKRTCYYLAMIGEVDRGQRYCQCHCVVQEINVNNNNICSTYDSPKFI